MITSVIDFKVQKNVLTFLPHIPVPIHHVMDDKLFQMSHKHILEYLFSTLKDTSMFNGVIDV